MELDKVVYMEVLMMIKAYGLLYNIENTLRSYITHNMSEHYGNGWYIKAPVVEKLLPYKKELSSLYLHELIAMVATYDCLKCSFDKQDIHKLRLIIPIRNKIAHSHNLSNEEYEKLYTAYLILDKVTNDKS